MPTILPALKGIMGSTTYYLTTMTARALALTVRPARDTERWASMSIDERLQREPNLVRVKKEMAPYLANHPDRFFGSVIVLVPPGTIKFEPLTRFQGVPEGYREATSNVGFLVINDGEHIALDGQHRLLAMREMSSFTQVYGPLQDAANKDEVSVILIEFESDKKTRTIFNKVNRYAKPTGAFDNIVTSETDGFAIVTRRLMDQGHDGPLRARPLNGVDRDLVEWQRTSLIRTSSKLTTITALYETVVDILVTAGFGSFSEKSSPTAPPDDQIDEAYGIAKYWWEQVLAMPQYQRVLDDPDLLPDLRHSPTHEASLLYRPVGQIALLKGLCYAHRQNPAELPVETLVERASRLNWSPASTSYWRGVIVKPDGNMIAKREAYELAAVLLEYLISPNGMSDEGQLSLWTKWNTVRGRVVGPDVTDLAPEELPQELPTPIA